LSPADDLFERALVFVLKHEGGLSNDPADPGGITNFGISLRFLRAEGLLDLDHDGLADGDVDGDGDVDADDIRTMPRERAAQLYRSRWWDRHGYARIIDPAIAIKTFDLAVNMGPGPAHRCLQRAVRACWFPVSDDGVLGPKSISAVNAADARSLIAALKSEAAGFYRGLVLARPPLGTFEKGWLNRAYAQPT